jgi:15-hydroxyprostaglandin dehydrogenase (NAD)
LTRTIGASVAKENITVNAVCPGIVPTGIMPATIPNSLGKSFITPTSTVVKAINTFLNDRSLNGQIAECSGEDLIYRHSFEPENEAAKNMLSLRDGAARAEFDTKEIMQHAEEKQGVYKEMESGA